MVNDIKKTTVKGILSIGSFKVIQQGINFILTAILANLLTPEDFGLVGIVTVFAAFISIFSNLGLGSALVQQKNLSDLQISTLFWIDLIGGTASALIISLAAHPISLFYEEPLLIKLTLALSINFLISPFYIINRKLLERELRFNAMAVINIVSISASGIFGVLSALLGFGVWSLIMQSISLNIFSLFLFKFARKWTPKFIFDLKSCNKLIRFGFNMVGTNLTMYLEKNMDVLMIGKLLGASQLGYYSLAFRVMFFPIRQISYIFTEVLFPVFSKVQDQLDVVQNGYIKSIRFTSLITFPLMTIIFLLSENLVSVVFGSHWLPAAMIIKILAPAGAIQSISQISSAVFPAISRPDLRMKLGIFSCLLLLVAILIGSKWGIAGVAYAVLLSRIITFFLSQIFLKKILHISLRSILSNLYLSTSSCIYLIILSILIKNFVISNIDEKIIVLILLTFFYLFSYLIFFIIFDRKDIKYFKSVFFKKKNFLPRMP
jgi:PST family polysaccharide transporter